MLTQEERIAISKKIVQIPIQDKASDGIIAQIDIEVQKAQKEDNANKTLMEQDNGLINAYQTELQRYDGNGRNQLVEQDLLNAANRVFQNFFFPNDIQTPLPNVPDGVWKNFPAFSGSKAIGKNYNETYTAVTKEQDLIDAVNAAISVVESFSAVTRSTGEECVTEMMVDSIEPDPAMQSAATTLKNAVQAWEGFLNATYPVIPTIDTDPTRSAQNDAARLDITETISEIDDWQLLPDFDDTHGQTTCAGFNAINVSTLDPTKFRAAELQIIKDALTDRQSFIPTRVSQIGGHLGSISQDFATGEILSTSGFYGQRFRFIDARLNAIGGSLTKLLGLQKGQQAQEQAKQSNENIAQAYGGVMVASQFRAPATGNRTIHVLDASGFSVSDSVYVVAENQDEISANILGISGNSITLDEAIPQKYRQNDLARIYKTL